MSTMLPKVATFVLVFQMAFLALPASVLGDSYDDPEPLQALTLRVGAQDDIKTRNFLYDPDVWTDNVLAPVYDSVGKADSSTGEPVPYLLKGIDSDDNGTFDLDEYGVYAKEIGTDPRIVTAYYDFNQVYFHDGVQATMEDLLFSYHLFALDPSRSTLDVLKDKNNLPGTNYSFARWLWVYPVTDDWDPGIQVGANDSLTFALRFEQQANAWYFVRYTLNGINLMPRHIWEGTGKHCLNAVNGVCTSWRENIHDDFGYAYNPVTKNGVPASNLSAFDFGKAQQWDPADEYVVGTGPFKFVDWIPGVSAKLSKYEDYYADALDKNFANYMHQPYIDGMLFEIYKTSQAAILALRVGEIDVVSWSVLPDFVPDLENNPDIGLVTTAEKGFFYLGYNMRKSPWGYPNNDPSLGDDGYWLRKAIAHLIDKETIVTTLLQGYGNVGDQPVSPADVRWYNASVEKYEYNLTISETILDDHYTVGGFGLGYGPSGYRNLPNIGDSKIEILTPQADYDPIRAAAGAMIAQRMRDVGINVVSTPTAFGEIVERLDNRDMDLWILDWRIASEPPEYYHAFFYSGNALAGQNYPGFQNATFDNLIIAARAELDSVQQAVLIKECSGLLADALPYDVLYFRQNIEAYRQDRFINWTVGPAGSIFGGSFWSWIGIHPPPRLVVELDFPAGTTLDEGQSLMFNVSVTDEYGNPVDGAFVNMSVTPSCPGCVVPSSGITVGGFLSDVYFNAPEVQQDTTYQLLVEANTTVLNASASATIHVLNVDVEKPRISDVEAYPDPQVTGGSVNISSLITDDVQVYGAWVEVYDPSSFLVGNFTMGYDPSGRYYYTSTYFDLGTYAFIIHASDTSNNWNSSVGSFHIQKGFPPSISDVIEIPNPQEIFWPVNISAIIVDDDEVGGAWIEIFDPQGNLVGNYSMILHPLSGRYYYESAYSTLGLYTFRIWAVDTSDNWNHAPGDFNIRDSIRPIADAGPDQVVDQGDIVHFDGTGSTDNWRIENYTWTLHDGDDFVTLYGKTPNYQINRTGFYLVELEVKDPVGNSDKDTLWIQVVGQDSDGDGLTDWDEENIYGTDAQNEDTDGDGITDGVEVAQGTDPLIPEERGKPFFEEFWWIFLATTLILLALLIVLILLGRRRAETEREEETE